GCDSLLCVGFQKSFSFQRGHASGAGGSDRLTEAAVLYVPASKHSRYTSRNVILCHQVAVAVHIELTFEYLGVGNVADPQKHSAGSKIPDSSSLQIAQL